MRWAWALALVLGCGGVEVGETEPSPSPCERTLPDGTTETQRSGWPAYEQEPGECALCNADGTTVAAPIESCAK